MISLSPCFNKDTEILGSVKKDLHDIGKNMVKMMLESNGFKVVDIGVNVPSGSFITTAKENNADVVAMSSLLTIIMLEITGVVDVVNKTGLKPKVKTMISGEPITREFAYSLES